MKTAGFGKIYMPYSRAYNITYRDYSNRSIAERDLREMQEVTGHKCYFCESFAMLNENRFHRIMHNLTVIMDMMTFKYDRSVMEEIFRRYSPDYASILDLKDSLNE